MSKTIVISGATGGIGEAVVAALARGGYRIFALGRSLEKLDALRLGIGDVVPVVLDLAALEDVPPGSR